MDRVRLVIFTEQTRPCWWQTGAVEGMVGDEVLVRFGEMVIQMPAEWIVSAVGDLGKNASR